ncbi:dTDP-4-dehydrorhamnose 3,5-epimerase [Oikeobacillus pervagus]|uniref:dTDP-4-dehydrorhamnose 3,5-epimerase n=1 Tax=Oikeobacillus pervagus TaxID=1325931 RepID=A0AAJ1WJ61_9BACI|nr:dTDP-4-dehydrorhamnose 3,5-epimerase [Oikeobacillus pervagus]MDQ0215118.1 dTDP-4-dehydrorhamnose 3,5-epimerase [Oikeobacillus pervagus]
MEIIETSLPGVVILKPEITMDDRGFSLENYNEQIFFEKGIKVKFIQEHQLFSVREHTVRGLHYQLNPKAQTKLVQVTKGAIFNVVLDLRKESPTFGKWESIILSDDNMEQLLIPKGLAHGFCTLLRNTEVQYKVDEYDSPELGRGIFWNDPALAIDWPITSAFLSDKDQKYPLFKDSEHDFK